MNENVLRQIQDLQNILKFKSDQSQIKELKNLSKQYQLQQEIQNQEIKNLIRLLEDDFKVFNQQLNSKATEEDISKEQLDKQQKYQEEKLKDFQAEIRDQLVLYNNQYQAKFQSFGSLQNQIKSVQEQMKQMLQYKVDQNYFDELRKQIDKDLDEKVDLQEVQSALNAVQQDISQRFLEFKNDIRHLLKVNDELCQQQLQDMQQIYQGTNSPQYVIHHSAGRLKDIKHNSGKVITGLTLQDFIIIPEKSKIGVSYMGDQLGEGFLTLKRL
ncbi:ATPase, V0 complex, c/d subunit [Pseudocohnilembus persalinus]|uniref:ATPase, V0 complex, c/d subunit n=1 Tax=Pseudocohnilembus persalinus TaxID=266149 RepID=A0A0V0QUX6_PSEPJ|nr:ATPase, V0 complex, c/d subunit [Pseudocohnilembus persalinus]|eukprot:KRX06082.1 ATPase, V0 complex, c/d subunit [Pseudocohnilembus persalinus]